MQNVIFLYNNIKIICKVMFAHKPQQIILLLHKAHNNSHPIL